MKRIISCLLAVALLLTLAMPVALAADERTSGAFTYRIKGNGTVEIVAYDWSKNSGDIHVPTMLDGYNVTAIGDEAFAISGSNTSSSIAVTLPATLTSIGARAFVNTNISSLIIPKSVAYIGDGAFGNCRKMDRFVLEPGNETFATIDDALYNKKEKKLVAYPYSKSIKIPDGIVEIGAYAFFGRNFGSINDGVHPKFAQWNNYFPTSIKKIGKYAFSNCTMYTAPDFFVEGLEEIDDYAFAGTEFYYDNAIQIPSTVSRIGKYAFSNIKCQYYNSSYFNAGRMEVSVRVAGKPGIIIDDYAFSGAYCRFVYLDVKSAHLGNHSLSNVSAPVYINSKSDSIGTMGVGCFAGTQVTPAILSSSKSWTTSWRYGTPNPNIENQQQLFLADSSNTIADNSFQKAKGFNKVKIADGIETVGASAFENSSITMVELPATLTTIEDLAFANCSKLVEVRLPAALTSIGPSAFNRSKITVVVDSGSYAEMWARENGYVYQIFGQEADDLSWLNN